MGDFAFAMEDGAVNAVVDVIFNVDVARIGVDTTATIASTIAFAILATDGATIHLTPSCAKYVREYLGKDND